MASPQTNNGYIRIATEIVEALMKIKLSPNQNRLLWVILRKTYGWNKKEDQISLSQFEKMTGIKSNNVIKSLKELEGMNIINKNKISSMETIYSFQKNYEKWITTIDPNTRSTSITPYTRTSITPYTRTSITPYTRTSITPYTNNRQYKDNIKDNIKERDFLVTFSSLEEIKEYINKNNFFNNKETVSEFIFKVMLANKNKKITQTRVNTLLKYLKEIIKKDKKGKYLIADEQSMIKGIESVFKKDDFDYIKQNPTGYIKAAAKSIFKNRKSLNDLYPKTTEQIMKSFDLEEKTKDVLQASIAINKYFISLKPKIRILRGRELLESPMTQVKMCYEYAIQILNDKKPTIGIFSQDWFFEEFKKEMEDLGYFV